jgi:hypothetical protein
VQQVPSPVLFCRVSDCLVHRFARRPTWACSWR